VGRTFLPILELASHLISGNSVILPEILHKTITTSKVDDSELMKSSHLALSIVAALISEESAPHLQSVMQSPSSSIRGRCT